MNRMSTPFDFGLKWGDYFNDPFDMNKIHLKGTVIEVKDDYIKTYNSRGEKQLWKYAIFDDMYSENNVVYIKFRVGALYKCNEVDKISKYAQYFIVKAFELCNVIKSYYKDICYNVDIPEYTCLNKDKDVPGMKILWILMIIVMLASTVLNEFLILWFIELFIFYIIRESLRN